MSRFEPYLIGVDADNATSVSSKAEAYSVAVAYLEVVTYGPRQPFTHPPEQYGYAHYDINFTGFWLGFFRKHMVENKEGAQEILIYRPVSVVGGVR